MRRFSETNKCGPAQPAVVVGWRHDLPWIGGLISVILLVFWPLTRADFVNYDDPDYVTQNPHVLQGVTTRSVVWAFSSLYNYWQPLTWLSYMVDHELYGLNPSGFHFTNLFLHVANSLVLFLALRRLTGAHWRSLWVTALFALHPLHVETVAWVSERKGLLSTFFWFLALWAYADYAERGTGVRYLRVALCLALGLMAKSMVVTLPCLLLLLDFWPLQRTRFSSISSAEPPGVERRGGPTQESIGRLLWEKLPLLGLSAASSVLSVLGQRNADALVPLSALSVADRLANAALGYARYLAKTLWPVGLSVSYRRPDNWALWQVVGAAGVVLLGCVLAVYLARRQPYLFVGWFWFLGTLVPVIGLLQVGDQSIADRYTYVPLVGLFILTIWGVSDFACRDSPRRSVAVCLGLAVVTTCAVLTAGQAQRWRDTKTLFEHAWRVDADNPEVCTVIGSLRAAEGRYEEAMRLFEHALRIAPTQSDAHVQWGLALERQGRLEEAIHHYTRAVTIKPSYLEAHLSLALALVRQGKYDEAVPHYLAALRLNPESTAARNNLALAFHAQGRLDEAITQYLEALRLDPGLTETHNNVALALHARGRLAEAISHYEEVLRRRPDSAAVHLNLGGALMGMRRADDALKHYREALRLSPDHPDALNKLAWLLATSANPRIRDGAEALRLAQRACALTGYKDPKALSTLAAAHAANGQFAEAVTAIQDAIRLAAAIGNHEMAGAFQILLREFQERRAYREGQGVENGAGAPE